MHFNISYFLCCVILAILLSATVTAQTHVSLPKQEEEIALSLPSVESERDWFYTTLEVNYVMLNTLDLITTFAGLENGAQEANPIAKLYVDKKPLAILVKGSMTAGTLMAMSYVKKQNKTAAYLSLTALNIFYGIVVGNNIGVYFEVRR